MRRNGIVLILNILILFIYTGCVQNEKVLDAESLIPIYGIKEVNKDGRYKLVSFIDTFVITTTKDKLIDKARLIAQTTSERYFSGLKLEVMGIDSINGVLTLKVNLIENKDFTPIQLPSWFQYFQGSYGGNWTSKILITNFLQTDYKAKWIDSVMFYYQGNEFGEWDHIVLGEHDRF